MTYGALRDQEGTSEEVKVAMGKQRRVRVIIFDIPDDLNNEEVATKIKEMDGISTGDLTVVRDFKSKNGRNIIVELNAREAGNLIEKRKLHIDYSILNLAECQRIIRCFKCQKYGHTAIGCSRPVRCAGWKETTHNCTNCRNNNSDITDHRADNNRCPVFLAYRKSLQVRGNKSNSN